MNQKIFPTDQDDAGAKGDRPETRNRNPKDRWFDFWLCAKGEPVKALTEQLAQAIVAYERAARPRERARRTYDADTYRATLEAFAANLAYFCIDPPPEGKRLALPIRKGTGRNRYNNPALSTIFVRDIASKLITMGAIGCVLGKYNQATTTIFPMQWFYDFIKIHGVSLDDIGRRADEEVIILKVKEKTEEENWTFENGSYYANYVDTDTTHQYRAEVRALNLFLDTADIAFIDDYEEPKVQVNDRRLRRHFTSFREQAHSFDRSGRLFGGWWLNLSKSRRSNIRVQGEPLADLDYASMFGRLAYARIGVHPPEGDIYDLTGLLSGYDTEVSDHRKGVKKVFNAMLFGGAMGKSLPDGARALLPKNVTVEEVRDSIYTRNPALKPSFGTKVGYHLMFEESRILLAVLQRLMVKGVVSLPIHDGLMTPIGFARQAQETMSELAKEMTGYDFPVSSTPVASSSGSDEPGLFNALN